MRVGFIVNPIAGMGGKVGLKGTDNILKLAIKKGAESVSPKRATEFLQELKKNMFETRIEIVTCPGVMGRDEAEAAKFDAEILPMEIGEETTAKDTKNAVQLLIAEKVDLMVFVGGDGTAKDVLDTLLNRSQVPVLGVPSGVKMYSGIFAVNPSDAAEVVLAFARKEAAVTDFEIMDADENAIRSDHFSVKLHGYLKGPFLPARIQGSKQISPETVDETDSQKAIGRFIIEEIPQNATLILGPGTTVKEVAELLNVKKTVLGVDLFKEGKVMLDANERRLLEEVDDWSKTWIIVSPIGHQGILFGRGNQQISPKVIELVGKQHIIVAATKSKLQSIEGNGLRVDTGNTEVDRMLKGYIKVVTDYREWRLVKVR